MALVLGIIPHGETDQKSTFRTRLGMNKSPGIDSDDQNYAASCLLLYSFLSITSNHVFNQPALGKSTPNKLTCERDDTRLVVTDSGVRPGVTLFRNLSHHSHPIFT